MNEDKAIMYSRQQPARVLIPVNYNHLGAHYELIPVEFKQEKYPKPAYRKGKRMIIQGNTIIPDFNKAKERHLLRYARFCKQSFRSTKLLFPKSSQALHLHFLLNFNGVEKR